MPKSQIKKPKKPAMTAAERKRASRARKKELHTDILKEGTEAEKALAIKELQRFKEKEAARFRAMRLPKQEVAQQENPVAHFKRS